MAIKVPNLSSLLFLDAQIAALLEGAFLRAYQNDLTPDGATELADLVECDFDGYAEIELIGWSAAALNLDNKAATELPSQVWTCSGSTTPNDVFGVYAVSAVGDLLYVERSPSAPVTVNTIGQTYTYLPRFTERSEF